MGKQIIFSILQHEGKMTVLIEPKGLDADIQPLSIVGTPEELDNDLFDTIGKTLEDTKGIGSNIKVYESAIKKAEQDVKDKAKNKSTKRGTSKAVKSKIENVENANALKESVTKTTDTKAEVKAEKVEAVEETVKTKEDLFS